MKPFFYRLTFILAMAIAPALAQADVSVFVGIAPPILPVYVQPPIPGDGYIWTPGYWAWSDYDDDYYWVPGTWVLAPYYGALWTPGYWSWWQDGYRWHGGYWATSIGFYGGINYGFGYFGVGYQGGRWDRDGFAYNRSVNNITNVHVTNVYNSAVVNNTTVNRISYNGGNGGTPLQPTKAELAVANMQHTAPTPQQRQHEQLALASPVSRVSINHGVPKIAATREPARFDAPSVVAAQTPQRPAVQSLNGNNHDSRPQA